MTLDPITVERYLVEWGAIVAAGCVLIAVLLLMTTSSRSRSVKSKPVVTQVVHREETLASERSLIRQQQIEILAEEFTRAEHAAFRDAVRRRAAAYFAADAQQAAEAMGIRRDYVPWKLAGTIAERAGWDPYETTWPELCGVCGCGRSAIKSAASTLEVAGLISRTTIQAQTARGKIEDVGIRLQLNAALIRQLLSAPEPRKLIDPNETK